jgi:hypothetical protein
MSPIVRAEIIGNAYTVGDINADTLGRLCIALLAAGFPPGAAVECYRPGRDSFDVRCTSIRAAAEGHLTREGRGCGPLSNPRLQPRRERTDASQNRSEAAS